MASRILVKSKQTICLIEIKPVRNYAQFISVPEGFV
jgi:hypothetical protein